MTIPTGNGEKRGPESADGMGTPLPGSRPSRAAKNDAAHPVQYCGPAEQGGFGKEDMMGDCSYMGAADVHAADIFGPPPDLSSLGNGGETFGGM